MPESRLRVLMLATYFPRPANSIMGNWALAQAQALARRNDVDLKVISLTPWVPSFAETLGKGTAFATCPMEYRWGPVQVFYPRCLWYPVEPLKRQARRDPHLQMSIAWRTGSRYLNRMVAEFKPHLTYAHHTAVNGFFAERLRTKFRIPYVITDHDFDEIADCGRYPARKRFFAPIVEGAGRLVSVASRMEAEMKRQFPSSRACTINNGTDPIADSIRNTPRPEALGTGPILFSCGAFYGRKGFPLLIEAFARVAPKHPDARLRIAGAGELRAKVVEAIEKHGLGQRVELLGFVPHQTVLQEMCWSDAFVLIGWDEPFATVFTEAMSAGKPVICANDGGINDVVENEVHGLTVPPKDVEAAAGAMDRILSDGGLRARLGTNAARLFATRLTWDHNAARMTEVFRSVAGEPPEPSDAG